MNKAADLAKDVDTDIAMRLQTMRGSKAPPTVLSGVLVRVGLGDQYFRYPTVAGEVYIAYNSRGISLVERLEDTTDFEFDLRFRLGRPAFFTANPATKVVNAVEAILSGQTPRDAQFDLTKITPFQQAVLRKALDIPYGQIRPYGWIAREIGRPKAQRAVGSALAANPIPLLIPCHRVVRNDGIIGNYGMGGPDVKKSILGAEGIDLPTLELLTRRGLHFYGSDTTHIFCFPTCRHAQRVASHHLQRFHSADEARSLGYRPCKVCRPALLT